MTPARAPKRTMSRIVVAYTVDLWQRTRVGRRRVRRSNTERVGPAPYAARIREIVHDFLDYMPEPGEGAAWNFPAVSV